MMMHKNTATVVGVAIIGLIVLAVVLNRK